MVHNANLLAKCKDYDAFCDLVSRILNKQISDLFANRAFLRVLRFGTILGLNGATFTDGDANAPFDFQDRAFVRCS